MIINDMIQYYPNYTGSTVLAQMLLYLLVHTRRFAAPYLLRVCPCAQHVLCVCSLRVGKQETACSSL